MKGKFLLSVLTLIFPASLAAQVTTPPADAPIPFQRYEVFAGADYISANQVKNSSALVGFNVGADAKLVKWFGGEIDFGDFVYSTSSLAAPRTTTLMAGPQFFIPSDKITGFIHVLFGGEHNSNAGIKPDISFAYALGGGVEYALSNHLSVRVSGDAILSATTQDPNNLGFSPHTYSNGRASGGVAYHF